MIHPACLKDPLTKALYGFDIAAGSMLAAFQKQRQEIIEFMAQTNLLISSCEQLLELTAGCKEGPLKEARYLASAVARRSRIIAEDFASYTKVDGE